MRKKFPNHWQLPIKLFGFGLITTLIFLSSLFLWGVVPNRSNEALQPESFRVKVLPKSSVLSIATQLQDQGIAVNGLLFQIGARMLLVSAKLKPGTYRFPLSASTGEILMQMARGESIKETIAFVPGIPIWHLRSLVDGHPALVHQTQGMSSAQLLSKLGLNYPSLEGVFFPDTYTFDPDESDIAIYRRAAEAMQKNLAKAWQSKSNQSALKSPYELLILASIVEKETGKASERTQIAAVFNNRLKKGMRLQTDPTVIYGIGPRFDGNLRKSDLRRDTPYNTYMHAGLPPTPIAIPSQESLLAAANPAVSNALYFVAKGDGSSYFSNALPEHERAVDRYQRRQQSPTLNRTK